MKKENKKRIFLSFITAFVSLSVIGCQSYKTIGFTNNKSTFELSKVSELKDILPEIKSCDTGNMFQTKSDESDAGSGTTYSYALDPATFVPEIDPKPHPRFDAVLEVPEDARTGTISVFFKDEYQIRLKTNEKTFYHLSPLFVSKNAEPGKMKNLNGLIRKYKAKISKHPLAMQKTEEELNQMEREAEAFFEVDMPNKASIYDFHVEDIDVKDFVEDLRENQTVLSANYIYLGDTNSIPYDPVFMNGSNLGGEVTSVSENNRYHYARIGADKAWEIIQNTKGTTNEFKPVKMAVIDVGFAKHDDVPYENYDYDNRAYCSSETGNDGKLCQKGGDISAPTTINGAHGSEVSSIINATSGNNKGVAGLAYNIANLRQIIPIKIESKELNNYSLPFLGLVDDAIYYAIKNGAQIINISLGYNDDTLEAYDETTPITNNNIIIDAISYAYQNDVLIVLPAGNENKLISDDNTIMSMIVGGTAKYKNKRWYKNTEKGSNYGKRIDISAPAEEIIIPSSSGHGFVYADGTSLSAPMVSAAASLIKGYNSGLSVNQIRNLIIYSATLFQPDQYLLGSNNKFTEELVIPGGRLLNIGKALELAMKIKPGGLYLRVYNADSNIKIFKNDSLVKEVHFGEEYIEPVSFSSLYPQKKLYAYNYGCSYSWGYQYWDFKGSFSYVEENIGGIAGQYSPEFSPKTFGKIEQSTACYGYGC